MTIDDKIRDENLQYDTKREAAKISALSSGKIDKYDFLTGEEILPPDQRRMIKQAKFTNSPLGIAFEEETNTTEDQEIKQVKAVEVLKALKSEENQELGSIERHLLKKHEH